MSVAPRIAYAPKGDFHRDLMARVDAYFDQTGLDRRDDPRALGKAVVILGWAAASYALLVFFAAGWLVAAAAAVSLTFAAAGIPMALGHDGLHQAMSRRRWVNFAAGATCTLIGLNPVWWRYKHNVLHHGYTNIAGIDDDLDLHGVARFSTDQPWHAHHRFQPVYMWLLYPLLHLGMAFTADVSFVLRSRIGTRTFPVPRRARVGMVAGKALGLLLMLAVPLTQYSWQVVIPVMAACSLGVGTILSVVFQLEHCVTGLRRPLVDAAGAVDRDWATSQVEGAADVAPNNALLTWYTGALNFHIEHHLFPRVSHVHYKALAPIVRQAAAEHGLHCEDIASLRAGLVAHTRFLRALGARPVAVPVLAVA